MPKPATPVKNAILQHGVVHHDNVGENSVIAETEWDLGRVAVDARVPGSKLVQDEHAHGSLPVLGETEPVVTGRVIADCDQRILRCIAADAVLAHV